MGKVAGRVKKVLDKYQGEFSKDPKFRELQKFYLEMQAEGIAEKQEYSLPQLDTVGHRLPQK